MARPTVSDVHIEGPPSNISIAYRNETYIADQVFPVVTVENKTDHYFIFTKGAWFRDDVGVRAPGTRAKRVDYAIETASYLAINYAIAKAVPDEVRNNADVPLRPDVEATEFVTDALLRAMEIRVAALTTSTTGWTQAASPTTQWDSDTSDPWGDIDTCISGIVKNCGRLPNVAVMSWGVWRHLRQHPDFLDRVKHTRPSGRIEPGDLRSWFGFDKVLISPVLYDTALEGQTASMTYIWGDDFWCGHVPANATLMTPAAGYCLEWGAREVRRFREEQERQDILEAAHHMDEVVTASDAGGIVYSSVSAT
jgi:hypothetical protein